MKERLKHIQLANEDQLFECLQDIVRNIDQAELNDVFQVWARRLQEISQGKAMETMSDDKSFSSILIVFNFIRPGWRMCLSTR
jgi:hypothetical protein